MKISIITVNLNNADGLRKTIDSVINQTYTNIEHIIIDGGSTDGSVDVIKEYEPEYKNKQRHLYWVSEPDKGIYNGMNKGIDRATGDYLLFLNSGDYLVADDVIEKFVGFKPVEDIVYGDQYIYIENEEKLITWHNSPKILDTKNIFGPLPHQSMFFKKQIFSMYGAYNEDNRIVSDWEYYLRLFLLTNSTFRKIDMYISIFEDNGLGTVNVDLRNSEREKVIKRLPIGVLELIDIKNRYNDLMFSRPVKLAIMVSNFYKKIKIMLKNE